MRRLIIAGGLTILAGCITVPSIELAEARAEMEKATRDQIGWIVPSRLRDAEYALLAAERAHEIMPGTEHSRHLAYLALRRTQIAQAYAQRAIAISRKEHAEHQAGRLESVLRRREHEAIARASWETETLRRALIQHVSDTGDEVEAEARADTEAKPPARPALLWAPGGTDIASLEQLGEVERKGLEVRVRIGDDLMFAVGESALLPMADEKLRAIAAALKGQGPKKVFVIEGHTDASGDEKVARQLSLARARAVLRRLVELGAPQDRLQATGYGPASPVASNDTPAGRAENRRIELVIRDVGEY